MEIDPGIASSLDLAKITSLVESFRQHEHEISAAGSSYNETQARHDYITPLIAALGWDVSNTAAVPQRLRPVLQEFPLTDDAESDATGKRPDYTLRLGGQDKLFIEAKKPSVSLFGNSDAAFQVRRYGWSAGLHYSVLTNFRELLIYDCSYPPDPKDSSTVGLLYNYDYSQYPSAADKFGHLISQRAVAQGAVDFPASPDAVTPRPFDHEFLQAIEKWRLQLAQDIFDRNKTIGFDDLDPLVQRVLNRIIFLRICEARAIELGRDLRDITTYDDLKNRFRDADERYNSNLFDFIEDQQALHVSLNGDTLVSIFQHLYYPYAPYDFTVVRPELLGEIYESFLGNKLTKSADGTLALEQKPEIAASGGVVATPPYIATRVTDAAFQAYLQFTTTEEAMEPRCLDMCCGSGSFLIASIDRILSDTLEVALVDGSARTFETGLDQYALVFEEKLRLIQNCIYGVDIDPQATEVTRFGLLIKLLEDQNAGTLPNTRKLLPDLSNNIQCGNSLVDDQYFSYRPSAIHDAALVEQLGVFNWDDAFPTIIDGTVSGGFDIIVGNPPYLRIQNIVRLTRAEADYFRSSHSPFRSARGYNYDKYYLFIERALNLLGPGGCLAFIVPNKFFTVKGAAVLRSMLTTNAGMQKIVDFGANQVFPRKLTYTAIIAASRESASECAVEKVQDLLAWRNSYEAARFEIQTEFLNKEPWVLVTPRVRELFSRIYSAASQSVGEATSIFVGVQTSADDIFVIPYENVQGETGTHISIDVAGSMFNLEKAILRPCLKDKEVRQFDSIYANAHIIFPYERVGTRWKPISESQLRSTYPGCAAYFDYFRATLEQRNLQGDAPEWYRYGRSQSLNKFNGEPKLIWPVLSRGPSYALDELDTIFNGGGNGPYYGLRSDSDCLMYYLLGYLRHPVIEAMVRTRSSVFQGDYYSHGKYYIENLPLVTPSDFAIAPGSEVVRTVRSLLDTHAKLKSATAPRRRENLRRHAHMLDERLLAGLNEILALTDDDLHAIQADQMFSVDTPNGE